MAEIKITDDMEQESLDYLQNYTSFTGVSRNMLNEEISGIYGDALLKDLNKIIRLYNIYEKGARFTTEGSHGDYLPAQLKYKQAKSLVDKQARFMFSSPPEVTIDIPTPEDATEAILKTNENNKSAIADFVDKVLKGNMFNKKLLQAGKDCFIGKRIAIVVNFNTTSGISISILPSLGFVYETDKDDPDKLTKLVTFYTIRDSQQRESQRIYKKKYELLECKASEKYPEGRVCHIIEQTYNGLGQVIETTFDNNSEFGHIPGTVIVNDGLTGDIEGESEIENLRKYEAWLSRLSNADMDAMRKGMNQIKYSRDMTTESTKSLSNAAGAFWDLTSDDPENPGEVGVIENDMGYSTALGATLDRIKSTMYESIDMPDTSAAALKGVVSSGKTLRAVYWGLQTRCEEKWLAWRPAIEFIIKVIVEGGRLYPDVAKRYTEIKIPYVNYNVQIDSNYPIPEDESEEKQNDLAEVASGAMSRKSYMIKWRGMTPRDADKELKQIALEGQMMAEATFPTSGASVPSVSPEDNNSQPDTGGSENGTTGGQEETI